MDNWSSVFKEAFKDEALNYGEAGEIIIKEEDIVLPEPDFEAKSGAGPNKKRVYEDTEAGRRKFEEDKKRFKNLKEKKKQLMSKLFRCMDRDVRDKVTESPGYQEAYGKFDILKIWQITEQVVIGRGSVSVYTLTTKLLKLEQTSEYTRYAKDFREAVRDLKRQGTEKIRS
jgi:hypothetical protein